MLSFLIGIGFNLVKWRGSERVRCVNFFQARFTWRRRARRLISRADSPADWRVICTNFGGNKSTCHRKETWKGRRPTAWLRCNWHWWNFVGQRFTAVREKCLHQIWWLDSSQPASGLPPSLSASNATCAQRELCANWRGKSLPLTCSRKQSLNLLVCSFLAAEQWMERG